MSWYHWTVVIHLLAALVWLGGTFFLALVGAPVLRRVEPPSLRAQLFTALGERFRSVGWAAIGVLVATGLVLLRMRGVLEVEVLGSASFWASRFGRALAWKLGAVGVMVAASGVHDFWLGAATSRSVPGTPEAARLRRLSALLARGAALAGLVIVAAAVRLAR